VAFEHAYLHMPGDQISMTSVPGQNWRRGFWSLIAAQFQGAFNENGLKTLIIFIILAMDFGKEDRDRLVLVVGALFSAPFILFSMAGGYLADRVSKRGVTIGTKFLEIGVFVFATFALARMNVHLALVAVFLASTQAAIFGPSKYGLLPEILPPKLLSWGNGVLELGTFLAVIAGSVGGAFLADEFRGRQEFSGIFFLSCSALGLLFCLGISRVPAADPTKKFRLNSLGDLWSQIKLMHGDRILWFAMLGNTYFWFMGALLQFDIIIYGQDVLKLSSTTNGLLQAALAIGIGIGSLAAGFLSGGKIEYGLVPLGSFGMTMLGVLLSRHGLSFVSVLAILAGLGFAGGFFVVPVNALIQRRPDETNRGGIIAAANLLSFVGIGAASGAYFILVRYLQLGPAAIFLWASLATLAATIYALYLQPDALLRLLVWILTHTLYRLHVTGREMVPAKSGAWLLPNHGSIADGALLIASLDRPIRFLISDEISENPLIKPVATILHAIPVVAEHGSQEMIRSGREAANAIQNGELVCILSDGQTINSDRPIPFREEIDRVMNETGAPIIPVNLEDLADFVVSFAGGRLVWKFPRHILCPVRVVFGEPKSWTNSYEGIL
jgi:acyl-[acyl-carrier-protein]-phospholipid O-acyltransferase/long-chain-fatty-acid--[acyl-carrier-protein] ligase